MRALTIESSGTAVKRLEGFSQLSSINLYKIISLKSDLRYYFSIFSAVAKRSWGNDGIWL